MDISQQTMAEGKHRCSVGRFLPPIGEILDTSSLNRQAFSVLGLIQPISVMIRVKSAQTYPT